MEGSNNADAETRSALGRIVTVLATIGLIAVVAWPVSWSQGNDSFPLSPYPMFARKKTSPHVTLEYAVALDVGGVRSFVAPEFIGSGEVLQARAIIGNALRRGKAHANDFCMAVLGRLQASGDLSDTVELRLVRGSHDAVAYLQGDQKQEQRDSLGDMSSLDQTGRAPGAWLDRWLRPIVPAERLGAVRVLVGAFALVYLIARFAHLWRVSRLASSQFQPIGVVRLVDGPLPPWLWHSILIVTTVLALSFVVGLWHRWLGPLFALGLLFTLTYRNCWGMVFHTENLLVLHVCILSVVPAAHAWSLDQRREGHERADSARYGWPLFLMCLVAAIAYFLAGVAKLRYGGISWGSGDVLRNYVAMDNVRKLLLGDTYSPLAGPSMRFDILFTLAASGSLLLELLAPVALFSKRFARLWVPSMVAFHLGIIALMAIVFPYPLCGIAFAAFYRAELLLQRAQRLWTRISGSLRS